MNSIDPEEPKVKEPAELEGNKKEDEPEELHEKIVEAPVAEPA